jgi:hypothetical protein
MAECGYCKRDTRIAELEAANVRQRQTIIAKAGPLRRWRGGNVIQLIEHRFRRGRFIRWWIVYRINDYGSPVDVGMSQFLWLAHRRNRRAADAYVAMKDYAAAVGEET